MPWMSANLSDALSGATAQANGAIADAQKALAALNAQTTALRGKMTTALNAVTSNKSMLDKMTESGFYMITLDPQVGSWSTRLANAAGEPPDSGYSAGTANLILSADPAIVTGAYTKLKDALSKPVADAAAFIDQTDFSDFLPDAPAIEDVLAVDIPDWDTSFPFNEWKSAKLGDVFGGAMSGLSGASSALNKQAKGVLAQLNHVGKITAALSKGLTTAQGFMNDLASTGAYTIMLPPGAGGYLTRLQSEAGAPPADPGMYCAGFVCVAVADGLDTLANKYQTLNTLMKG